MASSPPELIAIDPDEHHAEFVGRTMDGRQFFLTAPFEDGRDFLALYLFDAAGKLLEAKIDDLGMREDVDHDTWVALRDRRLEELGPLSFERIEIAPFSIERFGTVFGLVPLEPEDDDDSWVVELQPGNFMAFYPPWDSGVYDT